jgi:ABC-type transporter Mla MlaB component
MASDNRIPKAERATGVFTLRGVTHGDQKAACERLHALASSGRCQAIACDVGALAADVGTVEALARLALVAKRLGYALKVRGASTELRDLVELCGLTDALGVGWEIPEHNQGARHRRMG